MEFTNVLPGVKLVKQDEAGNEEELFVSQNDHVKWKRDQRYFYAD